MPYIPKIARELCTRQRVGVNEPVDPRSPVLRSRRPSAPASGRGGTGCSAKLLGRTPRRPPPPGWPLVSAGRGPAPAGPPTRAAAPCSGRRGAGPRAYGSFPVAGPVGAACGVPLRPLGGEGMLGSTAMGVRRDRASWRSPNVRGRYRAASCCLPSIRLRYLECFRDGDELFLSHRTRASLRVLMTVPYALTAG
jgi:hypothetical protein